MTCNILIYNNHPFHQRELKDNIHLSNFGGNISECSNKDELLSIVKKHSVGLVLVEVHAPGLDAYSMITKIIKHCPCVKVLVDSRYDEELLILSLIKEGIHGYILENDINVGLAIKCALSGQFYYSRELEMIIMKAQKDFKSIKPFKLNNQECKLLDLIAGGNNSNEIAIQLSLTKFTVETYRKELLKRFNVSNSSQLIHVAHKAGII